MKGGLQPRVVPDLGLQHLCGLLHGIDRGEHLGQVPFEQSPALGGGAIPFAAQARECLHLPDGHVRGTQSQQESDPLQVGGRIAPLAARGAGHGCNQPRTLVVAQRMGGEARTFSDLCNGEKGCHGTILEVRAHSKSSAACKAASRHLPGRRCRPGIALEAQNPVIEV